MEYEKPTTTPSHTRICFGSRFFCIALLLTTGCIGGSPIGPIPGSSFRGEAETATNDIDWSYAKDLDSVDIEIEGDSPRSLDDSTFYFRLDPFEPESGASRRFGGTQ